jgi:hypothetical protein
MSTTIPGLARDDAAVAAAHEESNPDPALMPLLHILAGVAQRWAAAAESPPGEPPPKVEAGAPSLAPASSSHPSTATCPLSCGEDRRA